MFLVRFFIIDGSSFSTLFMKSAFQDYQVHKTHKLSKVKLSMLVNITNFKFSLDGIFRIFYPS